MKEDDLQTKQMMERMREEADGSMKVVALGVLVFMLILVAGIIYGLIKLLT